MGRVSERGAPKRGLSESPESRPVGARSRTSNDRKLYGRDVSAVLAPVPTAVCGAGYSLIRSTKAARRPRGARMATSRQPLSVTTATLDPMSLADVLVLVGIAGSWLIYGVGRAAARKHDLEAARPLLAGVQAGMAAWGEVYFGDPYSECRGRASRQAAADQTSRAPAQVSLLTNEPGSVSRTNEPGFVRGDDCLRPVAQVELSEDAADVGLGGLRGDDECLADFGV